MESRSDGRRQGGRADHLEDHVGVFVTIPADLKIDLVDASALDDYELWFFLSSLLTTAVVGFVVAFIQSVGAPGGPSWPLFAIAVTFTLLLTVALTVTLNERSKLRGSRTIVRCDSASSRAGGGA